MFRFISFLVSVVLVIYVGVWLAVALAVYTIYVWLLVLIWNKIISEVLPLPEIGMFGGWIFSFFVTAIGGTIWLAYNLPQ